MENLFGGILGLEIEQLLLKGLRPDRTFYGNNPTPLQRPSIFDDISGVVAQQPRQILSVGIWIAGDILIERRERCRLAGDIGRGIGGILIGGDGDEPKQQSVEHAEAGKDVADDVVGTPRALDELPQDGAQEDGAEPVKHHKHRDHQDREVGRREVIDPVEHGLIPNRCRPGAENRNSLNNRSSQRVAPACGAGKPRLANSIFPQPAYRTSSPSRA